MLLSNHTPRRRPLISNWNTLLLPAFKDPRDLLEHLLDDVIRQVTEQAEDLEKAESAADFVRGAGRILSA